MGKKTGCSSSSSTSSSTTSSSSSWLTLVKRAFRSPTKDNTDKRNGRRREENAHEDEEKKREKRRWLFRKSSSSQAEAKPKAETCATVDPVIVNEQRHAIAVAAATAVAAEAAVATAQAAMEIARLTRPATNFSKENWAAVLIQTAFRGYLARRALRALKGLVKLQALVRGHNVRKQAKLTLQCMQALVRVQHRMRDQRARLSHEGSRKSMFAESNNLWESSYLQDIRERKSISRNTSCAADFWDEQPINEMVDIEAMLQSRKEVVSQRERALSRAFSQQMWRTQRHPSLGDEKEFEEEKIKWLDRWMATKQWESDGRASTDRKDNIKTVEIDTSRPYAVPRNGRRSASYQSHQHYYNRPATPQSVASPLHRAHQSTPLHQHSPATPSPSKTRPIQVRSASPRCYRDLERCYSAANTPSLAASTNYWLNATAHRSSTGGAGMAPISTSIPNYMAATESAKARARSQSAPRQRPSTPERDRVGSGSSAARKRLSYPVPDAQGGFYGISGTSSFSQNLRSPSFKSAHCSFYGMEQRSNLSCYTESLGGEISPCSTTDLRWFR
ncbi:protein IQ-DOMAIN 1-like [Punica granatum]|uniref:Protein IQ-DOMAIN 1-like n=1 Tax=Punica granatum TaxID=22663 RepID=A0A218WI90_PUNGR|nr:protein IQ-DOMAIN 1-like [Punica granatum]OWM72218.1 hypothetical protein CDL15_Pgr018103 [Punica granatum]